MDSNHPAHERALIGLHLAWQALAELNSAEGVDPRLHRDARGMLYTVQVYFDLLECQAFPHVASLERWREELLAEERSDTNKAILRAVESSLEEHRQERRQQLAAVMAAEGKPVAVENPFYQAK
jgi:hypothetical protein